MNLTETIQRMIEAGAPALAVAVAVDALESFRKLPELSGQPTEYEVSIWRKVERFRKVEKRKKPRKSRRKAEANDAARPPDPPIEKLPEMSGHSAKKRCDVSSFLSLEEVSKVRKKEVLVSARGTRLPEDWQPSEADRKFALDYVTDVNFLRDEFVDFWTSVPGQRGVKLDWSKTFRNRVRQIAQRKPFNGGPNASRKDEWRSTLDRLGEFGRSGDPDPDAISEMWPEASS